MSETKNSRILRAIPLIVIFFAGMPAYAKYGGGTGEPNDPYLIYTAEQLNTIGLNQEDADKHFKLMADIDLDPNLPGGQVFTQALIGDSWESEFTGCFDGGGHLIRNLVILAPSEHNIGLFGLIDGGEVRHLGLENVHITGLTDVGGLVGFNKGSIHSSYVTGSVSGVDRVGGLVGRNYFPQGVICSSYASVHVIGVDGVGGLVGENIYSTIISSYSTGRVMGSGSVGGLVGYNDQGDVYLSYWDIDSSALMTSAGGRGKTTEQMITRATFRGWGFDQQWVLDEGREPPRLAWEGKPGQPIVDGVYTYSGGTGEPNDPYQIGTADDLVAIGWRPADWGRCFVLTADFDMLSIDANEIQPIGLLALPFYGLFDGRGRTVSQFRYTDAQENYTGLFGYLGSMNDHVGVVRDLHLEGVVILGGTFSGGLAGVNAGTIISCSVSGSVTGENQIGGLVGYNLPEGSISTCASDGIVTGDWSVGGLIGEHRGMQSLTSSYSTSDVTGDNFVGGLVGQSAPDSPISFCYATGNVNGKKYVGGLVGSSNGSIMFCYAAGHVSGDEHIGGLTGRTQDIVYQCYWDIQTSGLDTSIGGRGKTTAQMKSLQTYRGWGYGHQWTLDQGQDYPHLLWEGRPGMPIQDEARFYGGGTGQPDDPYLIATAEDLMMLGRYPDDWDKSFVMTADITLAGVDPNEIIPIGTTAVPFTGMFDGAGHTIEHLQFPSTQEHYIGLFGCIGIQELDSSAAPGVVRDLHLNDVDILGRGTIGAIAGYSAGMIWACSVTGDIVGTSDDIGGLVGYNEGDISHSHMSGTVKGDDDIGGLVGVNRLGIITLSYSIASVKGSEVSGGLAGYNSGTITQCYATGDVNCLEDAGGLVSSNGGTILECYATGNVNGYEDAGGLVSYNGGTILDCYATGDVTGGEDSGGFVGRNSGFITACYATGRVTSYESLGGFVAYNSGDIIASFWNIETSGLTNMCGIESIGATSCDNSYGKTTIEMQKESTFLNAGWDFVDETANGTDDIWWINEGKDYPHLWWEATAEN